MKIQNISAQLLALGVTATLLGAGSAQAASLTLDNFQETNGPFQGVQVFGAGASPVFDEDTMLDPLNTIGGARDLEIERIVGGGGPFSTASGAVFDGNLDWSNDLGFTSKLTLQWDGEDSSGAINPTGLGGIDFTDGGVLDRFGMEFDFIDLAGLMVEWRVYTSATDFSILSQTLDAILSPQQEFFEFSDFAVGGGSGADFTNVGAVQLMLTGPSSIDARIALLEVTDDIPTIPEPSTLLGLGLLGGFGLLSANKKGISKS